MHMLENLHDMMCFVVYCLLLSVHNRQGQNKSGMYSFVLCLRNWGCLVYL
ncbi:hypothetical protein GLYMA_18G073450v4 [Glycine max]|nr:hypothetical protein GLYMA_18G073450v4 [Glycine max]KAH1153633.1 hypothetical protein GYH30_049323 [Glycine max]